MAIFPNGRGLQSNTGMTSPDEYKSCKLEMRRWRLCLSAKHSQPATGGIFDLPPFRLFRRREASSTCRKSISTERRMQGCRLRTLSIILSYSMYQVEAVRLVTLRLIRPRHVYAEGPLCPFSRVEIEWYAVRKHQRTRPVKVTVYRRLLGVQVIAPVSIVPR